VPQFPIAGDAIDIGKSTGLKPKILGGKFGLYSSISGVRVTSTVNYIFIFIHHNGSKKNPFPHSQCSIVH